MQKHSAIFLAILISIFSLNLHAKEGSTLDFFYSKQFAERFKLNKQNATSNWQDIIAVSIKKNNTTQDPQCKLTLYLGDTIDFKYPSNGNYINLISPKYKTLFYFQKKLNDSDSTHLTNSSEKATNKLELKSFNHNNKMISLSGLTIDSSIRNAVPGINIVKTLPFFCGLIERKASKIKLVFLDSETDGYITRSKVIQEYILPFNK